MAFSDVYRAVLAEMPGLSVQIVKAYVNKAHKQVAHRWQWSMLEQTFTFTTSAETTSDTTTSDSTVALTNDSATVTGTNTAFSSIGSGTLTELWHIRFNGDPQFYKISAVTEGSDTELTLAESYGGDSDDDATYEAFKYLYELSPTGYTVREVLSVVYENSLNERTALELDRLDPERITTGTYPQYWCRRGHTSTGVPIIELWPRPTDNITLSYRARIEPADLTSDSDTFLLDESLVLYTALINLMTVYTRMYSDKSPNVVRTLQANVKNIWAPRQAQLYSDLVMEDVRRHSTARKVRNVDDESSVNRIYYGDDITEGYP